MSDNVKSWGPLYITHCSPYAVGYHGTSTVFFPRTREYEFPFRHGRGIGVRLPTVLLMDGPDNRLWFRMTSKVFTIGLWRTNKRRQQWSDEQGLMWAMGGEETADGFAEIAEWTRPDFRVAQS